MRRSSHPAASFCRSLDRATTFPRQRDTASAANKTRTGEYAVWLQLLSALISYFMAPSDFWLSGGLRCSDLLGCTFRRNRSKGLTEGAPVHNGNFWMRAIHL